MEFFAPTDLQDALGLLARCGGCAKVVAGGTDVMVDMRLRQDDPDCLIFVGNLRELAYVREDSDGIKIGSLTTLTALNESPVVRDTCSALAQAAGKIGGPAIRNVGTVGGNLVKGSPAADAAVALLALDAQLKLVSQKGERTVPIGQFFTGPSKTVLASDELLTEIRIPARAAGRASCFVKFGRREAVSLAVVNTAVDLHLDRSNGRCQDIRIALGSVAPTPIRARKTEEALRGKALDEATVKAAAQNVADEIRPIDDGRGTAWYRTELSQVLVGRAVMGAVQATKQV
ncbi:MAG: xanthine dehydrogenase family protein subunit M [Chloroflexi bacterium]|nr:xanthine dehydrogenase family protein subunit M [Chloroflexota bacterium]